MLRDGSVGTHMESPLSMKSTKSSAFPARKLSRNLAWPTTTMNGEDNYSVAVAAGVIGKTRAPPDPINDPWNIYRPSS